MAPVTCNVWFEEGRVLVSSADTFWESYMPGPVVDTGDIALNQRKSLSLQSLHTINMYVRQTIRKYVYTYMYRKCRMLFYRSEILTILDDTQSILKQLAFSTNSMLQKSA